MLDAGVRWTDPKLVYPKAFFGVAQGYFSDVEGKLDSAHSPVWNYQTIAGGSTSLPAPPAGMVSLPTWNDELYFEYHRGVFTSQADHKRNMRESEVWMLDAEKYSSLAWLSGLPYPSASLNEAWKKVLFNQFHDLAAGSGIGVIYKEAQRDYDIVRLTADEASAAALADIASRVDTRSLGRCGPRAGFQSAGVATNGSGRVLGAIAEWREGRRCGRRCAEPSGAVADSCHGRRHQHRSSARRTEGGSFARLRALAGDTRQRTASQRICRRTI